MHADADFKSWVQIRINSEAIKLREPGRWLRHLPHLLHSVGRCGSNECQCLLGVLVGSVCWDGQEV